MDKIKDILKSIFTTKKTNTEEIPSDKDCNSFETTEPESPNEEV